MRDWLGKDIVDSARSKFAEMLILCGKINLAADIVDKIEAPYLINYYRLLSQYYFEQNDYNTGLQVIEKIKDDFIRIESISKIILHFIKCDEFSLAEYLIDITIGLYSEMDEESLTEIINIFFLSLMKCKKYETAVKLAEDLNYQHNIDSAFCVIITELSFCNLLNKSNSLIINIKDHKTRSYCFAIISKVYYLHNDKLNSAKYLNKAINEVMSLETIDRNDFGDEFSPRCEALEQIAIEFLNLDQNYINLLIQYIKNVKSPQVTLTNILLHPQIFKDLYKVKYYLKEVSCLQQEYSDYATYINLYNQIARHYLSAKKYEQVLKVLSFIQSKHEYDKILDELVQSCINKNDVDSALILAKQFAHIPYTCGTLIKISNILYFSSNSVKAASILELAKEYVDKIDFNNNLQQEYLYELSRAYLKMEMINKCIFIINQMSSDFIHLENAMISLALLYVRKNQIDKATNIINNVDVHNKSRAFKEMAIEYSKFDPLNAIRYLSAIKNVSSKIETQIRILFELRNTGELIVARNLAEDCLTEIINLRDERVKSDLIQELALFYVKIGDWQFALELSKKIELKYSYAKVDALSSILIELLIQNKIKEIFEITGNIEKHVDSNYTGEIYKKIGLELITSGYLFEFSNILSIGKEFHVRTWKAWASCLLENKKLVEVLNLSRHITNVFDRLQICLDVSNELRNQGKSSDALNLIMHVLDQVSLIVDSQKKYLVYMRISNELATLGNYKLAEKVGLEITLIAERHKCWKEIAKTINDTLGWEKSLNQQTLFQNQEARKYYLKSLAELATISACNRKLILRARRYYLEDIESLEKLMQKYALHELFFNEATQDEVEHLNRTLNIQWAIDIKNSMNVN